MAIYRTQSKLFAGVFDPGTYNSMVNAAANSATPDAQRMLDGYSRKYAEDIAKYKNSTALTTIKPNTNIPTGKPNTNIPTGTNPPNKVGAWQSLKNTYRNAGTMGKAGMIGAGILGTGLMVKGAMNMMGSKSKKETAFSEDEDGGSGMETLGKVALGTAALGGGLMAGKAGMLGTTVQRGIGTGMAKAGNMVGSQAMINSGAKTVGQAAKTDAINTMGGMGAFKEMSKANRQSFASMANSEKRDAIKGIMDKYKLPAKEAAFSEDTGAALQEAAIYGTIGAGTLGAIALAKRGKLGFTKAQRANNKEAYQKVVKKVKSVWAEQGNKAKEVTQETRTVKNPGKPAETTTKTTINKVTINKTDWPKVRAYMEANGMDLRDPSAKLKAAKAVGVTPSVK
jgi:hypothetical protein